MQHSRRPVTPRIERLTVKNFRVLRNVTLRNLPAMAVLLGTNGSGKSTVFDVFAFLFRMLPGGWTAPGLGKAWQVQKNRNPSILAYFFHETFPVSEIAHLSRQWTR